MNILQKRKEKKITIIIMTVEAPVGSYDVQASHGAVADDGRGGQVVGGGRGQQLD